MEWFWSQNRRKMTQKKGSWVLCAVSSQRRCRAIAIASAKVNVARLSLSATSCRDGVATKVLTAVAAVVATAACFRRLRAQLAATTSEIDELHGKLEQQQVPQAPPAPVAQAK